MQGTAAREVGTQEFHLVGQHAPALQVNILGMCRDERHSKQLHAGLLRCTSRLVVVATPTGRDDITPDILTSLNCRRHMVTGKITMTKCFTAIKTNMGITFKQGRVVEWRHIPVAKLVKGAIMALCRNKGV